MKKILLCAILLSSISLFSQETNLENTSKSYANYDTETDYGFKTGINISNYSSTNLDDIQEGFNDRRFGFMAGFFVDMHISGRFRFQPELLYSSQGSKEKALRADYLQLPLMLKIQLTNFVNVQFGPQIGVKIHEFEDSFKNFDYAVNGGIGIEIVENFSVEARYSLGLADMFDEDRAPTLEGKNAVIQIGVSYRL